MSRVPTENQYRTLRGLASGAAGLSWGKRHTEVFLRRGWVTAKWDPPFYQWVRITGDGVRALADAVDRYGLPEIGPRPTVEMRVCSSCLEEWEPRCRCGGPGFHYRHVEVDVPAVRGSS